MAKYKAYPEYQDSGVEWLGDIPVHWQMIPCRAVVSHISDKNHDGKIQNYLSLMANVGVIRYEDKGDIGNKKPDDLTKCKIVKKGQLVINSMNYGIGSYGMSTFDGVCSSVYIILEAKENILRRYALRIFENSTFQKHLATYGNGILEHRSAIKWDDIKGQIIPLPSKLEQNKILTFLDHETAKIDSLIEKQQQLIELLKEKRQAVISHAVTKGLNPDVPMKDSGVEWLGEVPDEWQVKQIRHISTSNGGGTPSKNNPKFWIGDIPWVSPKDMKVQYISDAEDHVSEDAVKQSSTKKIPIGSVLIVVRGMILAHSVPVAINTKVVTINQDMKALVPNTNISCDYLHLVLIGFKHILLELTDNSAHGTKCLRTDLFEKMWIPLPSLQQQAVIVSEISEQTSKIDRLINLQEEAKALLQERRTALISAAVTGKIDVRDWVAPTTLQSEEPGEASL